MHLLARCTESFVFNKLEEFAEENALVLRSSAGITEALCEFINQAPS